MEEILYASAKEKVKLKKEFYGHLTSFLTINFVMFFVVLFNGGGFNWLMPAFFWSIGLASHYIKAFGLPGVGAFGSEEWERREVQKEVRKEIQKYQELEEIGELELIEREKTYRTQDLV